MECYVSRTKLVGLLALTCVMVGASYFCTTMADITARVAGWCGVGFFSLGFVAFPVTFFRSGPQVVIGAEGIEDRRSKLGLMRWEDIRALSVGSVESTRFLCVDLFEPEKYLSRLPRWKRRLAAANEAMGFTPVTIGFAGLTPGIDEVWDYLQARGEPTGSEGKP